MRRNNKTNKGFVYFILIKFENKSYVKIGQTVNVEKRINYFKRHLPFIHFNLLKRILTADRIKLEKKFHRLFKAREARGEWFNLCDEDIEFILSLSNKMRPGEINKELYSPSSQQLTLPIGIRSQILLLLKGCKGYISLREIARRLGYSRGKIQKKVDKLVRSRKIKVSEIGGYSIS